MTNKQRVLKRYPRAYSYYGPITCIWYVYSGMDTIGSGETAKIAWANAAENLKRKKK